MKKNNYKEVVKRIEEAVYVKSTADMAIVAIKQITPEEVKKAIARNNELFWLEIVHITNEIHKGK